MEHRCYNMLQRNSFHCCLVTGLIRNSSEKYALSYPDRFALKDVLKNIRESWSGILFNTDTDQRSPEQAFRHMLLPNLQNKQTNTNIHTFIRKWYETSRNSALNAVTSGNFDILPYPNWIFFVYGAVQFWVPTVMVCNKCVLYKFEVYIMYCIKSENIHVVVLISTSPATTAISSNSVSQNASKISGRLYTHTLIRWSCCRIFRFSFLALLESEIWFWIAYIFWGYGI